VQSPTPTQAQQAQAWREAITPAVNRLGTSIDALSVACASDSPAGECQLDYAAIATNAQSLEATLDRTLPPACLADSAAQFRQAAGLIDVASANLARGTVSASLTGAAVMQDALVHLRAAGAEAQAATC